MERARKGAAILLNDVWHSAVFECVNSRILWIILKFSRVKVCVVMGYGPNEGDGEEMDMFWNDKDRILDKVENGYRLCILGDLNGDRTIAGITGAFRVPGENDNGKRVVKFCAERGLYVGNTYFEHKSLHKYKRMARVQDGVEVKRIIDLALVKKGMLRYVQEVKVVRRMGRGLLDDHVILCKVRLVGAWIKLGLGGLEVRN